MIDSRITDHFKSFYQLRAELVLLVLLSALITGLQRATLYDSQLKYSALQRKAADWQSGLENSTSNKGCHYPRCLLSVQEHN